MPPVQRKAWEDLSPEMQTEMTKVILQYADANDNMGQGAIRLFNGDEAFVREFYDAYLQDGERLDMWDVPTVDIGKLAEQLDGIQGLDIDAGRENIDTKGGVEKSEKNDIFDVSDLIEGRNIESSQAEKELEKPKVDNPFDEHGELLASVRYESGEFHYSYETDSLGRICNVQTDNVEITSKSERLPHERNTPGKLPGDHAGHLMADIFGGSNLKDNLVSQLKNVNQSEYRKIEIQWQKAIQAGQKVAVNTDVLYDGDNPRPVGFVVRYSIDGGEFIRKTIWNK